MAETVSRATQHTPSKRQLQRQMEKTRQSVSETVGEIKHAVNEQITTAKQTVTGILDYREEFQKEPLVWSLGALSAGFAVGYTMGYAHRETKRSRKKSEVAAFANSLVDELSAVGNSLVMPALNARIRELFGFDFAEVLESINKANHRGGKHKTPKKTGPKARGKSLPVARNKRTRTAKTRVGR
jgi:hypothetical protein